MCVCAKEEDRRWKEGRKKEEEEEGGTEGQQVVRIRVVANPCNRFVTTQRLPFFLSSPLACLPFSIEKNDPMGEGLAADTHSPISNGRREAICHLTPRLHACFLVSHGIEIISIINKTMN